MRGRGFSCLSLYANSAVPRWRRATAFCACATSSAAIRRAAPLSFPRPGGATRRTKRLPICSSAISKPATKRCGAPRRRGFWKSERPSGQTPRRFFRRRTKRFFENPARRSPPDGASTCRRVCWRGFWAFALSTRWTACALPRAARSTGPPRGAKCFTACAASRSCCPASTARTRLAARSCFRAAAATSPARSWPRTSAQTYTRTGRTWTAYTTATPPSIPAHADSAA